MRRVSGRLLAAAACIAVVVACLPEAASLSRPGGSASPSVVLHPVSSPVEGLQTGFLDVPDLGTGRHRVRVGVVQPEGRPRADVLFLHGHADRLDNHAELFASLARAGFRVVSFDLPSHGLTDAGPIDVWSFGDLAALAARVEASTVETADRPLLLAGWSFGGLLATRIAQDTGWREGFTRPLSGLALEVPALAPYPAAGGGVSRLRALTHDLRAPVAGAPRPASPLLDPVFAVRLLAQAEVAITQPLPAGLPTLVELSDPVDDLYVDSAAVGRWASGTARRDGAQVTVRRCPGARHGLDIEAYPIGESARSQIVAFAESVIARIDGGHAPSPAPVPEEETCR